MSRFPHLVAKRRIQRVSDLGLGRCAELRARIQQITDGEYATAKRDVDALRAELGQPPLPSLQATLEEKSQQ
jgi:hypothetical protein